MQHSHLLITINWWFDPAIFYTNQEYEEKYKKYVDVQACVEDPVWYILVRCPPSENQIMYSQIRLEDINKLKSNIKINGTEIADEMVMVQHFNLKLVIRKVATIFAESVN